MVRNLILGALVALAVTIYALIQCAQTPRNRVRSLAKGWWIVVIVLLPLVGACLWFWLGRPTEAASTASAQRTPRGPASPDDDPEFLRSLETQRRQRAKDEELRRREAELKAREARARKDTQPPNGNGELPSDRDTNPPSS
ncbi:MAG TPA: PLD nuclease N-terminal domain-containing protein [Arthrobacter sp.]|nr:PLD nuclease N-terminal domain-containing protein [Arthrobacter sp.]